MRTPDDQKDTKMLYLYPCLDGDSGRWLQSGSSEGNLRKYAEFQDYTIAGEYSDEGFSGKNIQGRLDFQRMLQDIQEKIGWKTRWTPLMYLTREAVRWQLDS